MTQTLIEHWATVSGLTNFVEATNPAVQRFVQAIQKEIFVLQPGEVFTPTERHPLTDADIEKLREKTFSTENPFCPVDSKSMRKAVRAAEAAHGIKGAA